MGEQLQLFEELLQDVANEPPAETMDILSKFAMVDIKTDQRMSAEELEFCKHKEQVYVDTLSALKQAKSLLEAVYETYKTGGDDYDGSNYLNYYSDIDIFPKKITSVYEKFISRITYYFAKRHNVTLSSEEIIKKYNEDTITYSIILDEIFEQLGGFTFKEKAIAEIKVNSRKTIYSHSEISISKNKLVIADFVWWGTTYDGFHEISYNDSKVYPLFLALSHFMDGSVNMVNCLDVLYSQLRKGARYYDIFGKYEYTHDKLLAIKLFKNGKIELTFADNTLAEEFKTEYLV